MLSFKGIVMFFYQKIQNDFFFVIAIYQAQNFTLELPLHEKMNRNHQILKILTVSILILKNLISHT